MKGAERMFRERKDMKWGLNQQRTLLDFREGGHGNSRQKLRFQLGSCHVCQNSRTLPPECEPQPLGSVRVPTCLGCREATQKVQRILGALGSLGGLGKGPEKLF